MQFTQVKARRLRILTLSVISCRICSGIATVEKEFKRNLL